MTKPFDASAACYCLILRHDRPETVDVGALGPVDWPEGWLYYAGRASRGWSRRFKRFNRESSSRFWHIDYLVHSPHARLAAVIVFPFTPERECEISHGLQSMEGLGPLAPGLGSSDCGEGCPAHGWAGDPSPATIRNHFFDQGLEFSGWVEFQSARCVWKTAG